MYADDEKTQDLKYGLQRGSIYSAAVATFSGVAGQGYITVVAGALAAWARLKSIDLEENNDGSGVKMTIYHARVDEKYVDLFGGGSLELCSTMLPVSGEICDPVPGEDDVDIYYLSDISPQ